ncbi:MFS general substrate transporter [Lophium mytilinum]|uniref:MFS general substrate transporter n=1 Tax=Lophium mytilinum TaxID=390894 RepID=A0A6A6QM00_9PEZI|nr:MFS general substrate transporter [Lophium mytilinum]
MPSLARKRGAATIMRDKTPFPTQQMAILALCRICEPIAFTSIFPYAYYMVQSFHVTEDKAQVAMYVGMVTSAFAFAECASSMLWGRLSDKIGRKSCFLGGLFGTGLSMCLFGFAKSLPMALFARAMGGLLNGNVAVLQTTVAELVTDEKHRPRAFSIMPSIWCLGTIFGSGLGGLLTEPVKNYPSIFSPGSIFDSYPYLLPNLVCTFVVAFALVVGFLFLEETHEDIKHERDRGLEAGRWLLRKIRKNGGEEPLSDKDANFEETRSMLNEDNLAAFHSPGSSPTLCSSRTSLAEPPLYSIGAAEKLQVQQPSWRNAFSRQVCLTIIGYGFLAFHTVSFEQLMPILMSLPESDVPPQLPLKFEGGFALSTKTIGMILSVQGIYQMFAQLIVFPWINLRLGTLRTFWLGIFTYPLLYVITPYLILLPHSFRLPGVFAILAWKVLGTLNGAAASSASVCRGFGPTLSGMIQSTGQTIGYSGLAWWMCASVALVACVPSAMMKEERKSAMARALEDDTDDEAALSTLVDSDEDDDDDEDMESVITLTGEEEEQTEAEAVKAMDLERNCGL